MREWGLGCGVFGERAAFGFWEEGDGYEADEEHDADVAACVAEGGEFCGSFCGGIGGLAEFCDGGVGDVFLEDAHGEGAAGGDEASDVVAEANAGAAESEREEFGQVDGEACEEGELAEAHEGAHPDVAGSVEEAEVAEGDGEGGDVADDEGGFAASALGEFGEQQHAEEGAEVLDDGVDSDPVGLFVGDDVVGHALFFEGAGDDVADEFWAKEADAPEANDTGDTEDHAEEGGFSPAGFAEKGAVGTKLCTGGTAFGAGGDPLFGFFEANLDEDAEERGQRSDEEHDFPHVTGVDFAFGAEFAEVHADEACGDVANGR
ncbi:MAG: hypothetical protein RIS92_2487, partial [Verrucomicrobiota bacterium]